MNASLKDWKNGWHGLELGLAPVEIERLIVLLRSLQENQDQHFHISSDYKASSGLGDIEVYIKQSSEPDNLFLSSLALPPGTEVKIEP